MRADDAARVRKTLLDHFPEVENVMQFSQPTQAVSSPATYWPSPVTALMSTPILSNGPPMPHPSTGFGHQPRNAANQRVGADNSRTPAPTAQRILPSAGEQSQGTTVRRELDFGANRSRTPRSSAAQQLTENSTEQVIGKKRPLPEPTTNENDPNVVNRQRVRYSESAMPPSSMAYPPPPLPPYIPGMHPPVLLADPRLASAEQWKPVNIAPRIATATVEKKAVGRSK